MNLERLFQEKLFFERKVMNSKISNTSFGSITIAGERYEHDVLIRLDGRIEKRKKKLSKQVYGTSHVIALAEAEFVYKKGAEVLLVGTGQSGLLSLSPEAEAFFREKGCALELLPTPQAILRWNELEDRAIALFHVTC